MRQLFAIVALFCGILPGTACAGEDFALFKFKAGQDESDPLGLRLVRLCREHVIRPMAEQIRTELQRHYSPRHLERLMASGDLETRRAATYCLGVIGDAQSASAVASALHDPDQEVCHHAETASWQIWARLGSAEDQVMLLRVKELIQAQEFYEAISHASLLVQNSPEYAEGWHQRATGFYQLRRYRDAIPDCRRTLELNPYHFGSSSRLAECHLRLNELPEAMDALQLTARLHPNMPGLQEQIVVLSSMMKK